MSVVIYGMQKPKYCVNCPLAKRCLFNGVPMETEAPEDCPIKSIPEKHGRLIDADALMNIFADRLAKVSERYGIDSAVAGAVSGAMELLDVQQTVIEALRTDYSKRTTKAEYVYDELSKVVNMDNVPDEAKDILAEVMLTVHEVDV